MYPLRIPTHKHVPLQHFDRNNEHVPLKSRMTKYFIMVIHRYIQGRRNGGALRGTALRKRGGTGSGETDGGGAAAPLAGHFEVFGPPVTTLLILLSDL